MLTWGFWLIFAFGVFHLAAYSAAAFVLVGTIFIDWIIKRCALQAEVIRCFARILADRRARERRS